MDAQSILFYEEDNTITYNYCFCVKWNWLPNVKARLVTSVFKIWIPGVSSAELKGILIGIPIKYTLNLAIYVSYKGALWKLVNQDSLEQDSSKYHFLVKPERMHLAFSKINYWLLQTNFRTFITTYNPTEICRLQNEYDLSYWLSSMCTP